MSKKNDNNNTCSEEQIELLIKKGIKKLESINCKDKKGIKKHAGSGAAGTVWFLGFVGAVIYFIQQATTFGTGVVGLFKALVWPAFLVHKLLEFLKV